MFFEIDLEKAAGHVQVHGDVAPRFTGLQVFGKLFDDALRFPCHTCIIVELPTPVTFKAAPENPVYCKRFVEPPSRLR